jgi:hypothetical protein
MVMKMKSKGQAALEFLTTYGWAFLVILIMISALAYFGVLNPANLLPDKCTFGAEIGCVDYLLDATGDTFRLRLKNNVGEVIAISKIELSSQTSISFSCSTAPTFPSAWKSGDIIDLEWTTCNYLDAGMEAGTKGKVNVKVTYYNVKSGSNYPHDVFGEVLATVS